MRKLMVGVVLILLGASAAQADWVYVDYKGQRERFSIEDFGAMNVCRFKASVGKRFNLSVNAFMLGPIRHFSDPSRSMKAAGIGESHILEMWDSRPNYQCD